MLQTIASAKAMKGIRVCVILYGVLCMCEVKAGSAKVTAAASSPVTPNADDAWLLQDFGKKKTVLAYERC